MLPLRKYGSVVRRAAVDFVDAGGIDLAAGLAFYALFALFPLLLSVLGIVGFLISSSPELPGRIVDTLGVSAGPALRQTILVTLHDLESHQTARGISAVAGLVVLLVTGGSLFVAADDAVRSLFHAPARPGSSSALRVFVVRHLGGAALAGLTSVAVLVSLVVTSAVSSSRLGFVAAIALQVLPIAGLLLVATAALRFVPIVRVSLQAALFGATVTTVLVTVLRWALAAFLRSALGYTAYGAFGALLGLALFIQLTRIVTLFGVSCARAYAGVLEGATPKPVEPMGSCPPSHGWCTRRPEARYSDSPLV
ncbi:MAG: YihY/virulence factor BrkB family protein [Myxococcales bacterium]|nr:YihY/virulence factor BrkB family protein [Myxococcales bacterium]